MVTYYAEDRIASREDERCIAFPQTVMGFSELNAQIPVSKGVIARGLNVS